MNQRNPHQKYIYEAVKDFSGKTVSEGITSWSCPSNIALIKYWGKKENQIPQNPSISFTLKNSVSRVSLEYRHNIGNVPSPVEFLFEGNKQEQYNKRIVDFIDAVRPYFPFLNHMQLRINSENSFPAGTGIASSASAFGSLALALTDIDFLHRGKNIDEAFYQKASYMARIGSGSASRSVYGGYVLWGKTGIVSESSDYFAVSINKKTNDCFHNYCDSVLIVSKEKKSVSSSAGHSLMKNNPFSETRFKDANKKIEELLSILEKGDTATFLTLVESEALALHAMMMTSSPYYILMKPRTLLIIEKIWQFRKKTELPVCFTLDAGANVHLLYPKNSENEISAFIDNKLRDLCEDGVVLHDAVGTGPVKL